MTYSESDQTINTEISELPSLINNLKCKNSLLKIHHLILNPFPLQSILTKEQLINLIKYNLSFSEEKIAIKNLAIIINNIFISTKKFELSQNSILGLPISNLIFWKIYCQFSKMNYFLVPFEICKKDSFLIQKLKIKIISYLSIKEDLIDGLKKIEPYLEEGNVQISWAISKAMHRIIRCTKNPKEILNAYLVNIELREVEFWINLSNIFALFLIEKKNFDFSFYKKMLFYDSNCKSNLVRESALFYVYILCKNNFEFVVEDIILISLFDNNVLCRKAAYSILVEYFSTKEIENKNFILEKIYNFSISKDQIYLSELLEIVPNLNIKTQLVKMLSNYNHETRNLAIKNLNLFFNCTKDFEKEKNLFFLNSILNFILTIEVCNYEVELINTIIFNDQLANSKLFFEFVLNYLKCVIKIKTVNLYFLIGNLNFLIEKNFVCDEIALIFKMIFDVNQNIQNDMFILLNKKRNDSILVANTYNTKFITEIHQIYKKRFNHITINCATLQFKANISVNTEIINLIVDNLENYSVDFNGDVGMKMRLEALKFMYFYDQNIFLKYFFRFLVDKSKFLRDFLIYNIFSEKSIVKFLNHTEFPINLDEPAILNYKIYYLQNKELNLGNDIVHFKSAFSIFHFLNQNQKKEFLFGCFNSLKNSDKHLFDYLFEKLNEIEKDVLEYLDWVFDQEILDRKFSICLYGCFYLKIKDIYILEKIRLRSGDVKSKILQELILKIIE